MKPYYEKNGITIYNADYRDVLPSINPKDVHLLLTDPYEMVASGGGIGAERDYLEDIDGFTDGGFDVEIVKAFPNWAIFCAKAQLMKLLNLVNDRRWMLVTWNKPNPTPLSNGNYLPDTEYVVHAFQPKRLFGSFKDKSRFIVHPVEKNKFDHPNVKPIAVVSKMVRLGTQEGELILDPFMGSGTTLRAAKDSGRRAIGIEIEEKYCEMAAKRLQQSVIDWGQET